MASLNSKELIARAELTALIECAEAAKHWQLDAMRTTSTDTLQAAWHVLQREGHALPLPHQWAFTAKFAAELLEEGKIDKWINALSFTSEEETQQWTAADPLFSACLKHKLSSEALQTLSASWVDGVLNNPFLQHLATTDVDQGAGLLKILRAFLNKFSECPSSRYAAFLGPLVKVFRGLHIALDPTPNAFGATALDFEFTFVAVDPQHRKADTVWNSFKLGPVLVRSLRKMPEWEARRDAFSACLGPEMTLGPVVFSITEEAKNCMSLLEKGAGPAELEEYQKAKAKVLGDFLRISGEAREAMRKDATKEMEQVFFDMVMAEWKSMKGKYLQQDIPKLEALAEVLRECKAVPSTEVLGREIQDTILSLVDNSKVLQLRTAASRSMDTLDDVSQLYACVKAATHITKDPDMQTTLREARDFVIACLARSAMGAEAAAPGAVALFQNAAECIKELGKEAGIAVETLEVDERGIKFATTSCMLLADTRRVIANIVEATPVTGSLPGDRGELHAMFAKGAGKVDELDTWINEPANAEGGGPARVWGERVLQFAKERGARWCLLGQREQRQKRCSSDSGQAASGTKGFHQRFLASTPRSSARNSTSTPRNDLTTMCMVCWRIFVFAVGNHVLSHQPFAT
jgi:hypothetical protein